MSYIIAIDLGGTKTITALLKKNKIIKKIKFATSKKGKQCVIRDLINSINLISTNINKNNIKYIIIGVASPIDYENGLVINAPNIKGFRKINLKKILENKFKIKVSIINDAAIQALGEYSIRQNINSIFYFTIGTGVGASYVNKGNVFATEFGHTIIKQNGNKCSCGAKGCLESYVSGHSITNLFYRKYKKRLLPSEILKLAKKGNKNAKKFLNEISYYFGIGLVNVINIFNPELIVINGGLSNLIKYIIQNAKKVVKDNKILKFKGKIIISKLQEDALFYGAIYIQGSSAVGP